MEDNALPSGYSNEMGTQKEVPLRKTTSTYVGAGSWWLTLKPFVNAGLAQTIGESVKVPLLMIQLPRSKYPERHLLQVTGAQVRTELRSMDFLQQHFREVSSGIEETHRAIKAIRKHVPQLILKSSLMKTVSVGSYEVLKKQVASARGMPLTLYQHACCGLLAGSIGAYICAPLTAAQMSIFADSKRPAAKRANCRSLFDAMYRIGANEGLPALWKRVELAFEESKIQLGAGAISGFVGTVCSEPVNTVARKVHKMKPNADGKYPYKGILDCASKLWKAGGLSALYPDFLPKSILSTFHAMIFWAIFEKIREFEEARETK